jgi:hypothetical protein
MEDLIRRYIPQSPDLGLYVRPDIPAEKVEAAVRDYARSIDVGEVFALFDATLLRTGKDGAVFTLDRLVFQNSNLSAPQEIRYADIVEVEEEKKLLGGRKVIVHVNRGQATVQVVIDFSGRPKAAAYVKRFLDEAMLAVDVLSAEEAARANLRGVGRSSQDSRQAAVGGGSEARGETDPGAVRNALKELVDAGSLSPEDFERVMRLLRP